MTNKCKCCNTAITDGSRLCPDCIIQANIQSNFYGVKLRMPIHNCLVHGCTGRATKNGLCLKHTHDYIVSSDAEIVRETVDGLTRGRLTAKLETLSLCESRRPDGIYHSILDVIPEMLGEGCEEESLLPHHLIDNPRFRTPENGYCQSKFNCFNSIYKDGLCKFHHEMKYPVKKVEEVVTAGQTVPSITRKQANSIPTGGYDLTKTKCATVGCNQQAYLTKYCSSCSNKRNSSKTHTLLKTGTYK